MQTMTPERKRQIRELVREKIRLEDLILHATSKDRIKQLEDDLYEIKDTLDKLTNGYWFEDISEHELQKERDTVH
jgi:hypothetical protein